MLNANDSQVKLEKYYQNCVRFWSKQKDVNDEKEAHRRALEYDLIEIYKANKGCFHDPFAPRGEELDKETTLNFFKSRCMDLYGKSWEEHWKEYNL